jgi:hypothetical protein
LFRRPGAADTGHQNQNHPELKMHNTLLCPPLAEVSRSDGGGEYVVSGSTIITDLIFAMDGKPYSLIVL